MDEPARTFPELTVACPTCDAAAGRLCTSHGGTRVRRDTVHQRRRTAWGGIQKQKARTRAARTASGASTAQKTWNRGKAGTPTAPAPVPTGRDCAVSGCGELASAPRPAARMVRVDLDGSREPARWYCPGPCRAYGEALAEVRAIGVSRA
ncbi:zinc finger domain-containing protein [Streptomyces nymphaeiformis]|jgi:hypothetical protein|uniref:DNA-binding phage zinc finger domain-containing protein n=1 Tax=Streptomyces nymphaeiformis TaxID=2663842 RepID=A0A7W7XG13_9ACTN|nr:hypothetical protein [Streptomyces nymphaeiformis]MBB4987469.1 hypothetical protein [Streptomyces nymphaeiformis]